MMKPQLSREYKLTIYPSCGETMGLQWNISGYCELYIPLVLPFLSHNIYFSQIFRCSYKVKVLFPVKTSTFGVNFRVPI